MTRSVAIALFSVLAAGAGCGGCVDDQPNPSPSSGPAQIPQGGGNLHRVERPMPKLSFNSGGQMVPFDAGAPADTD